MSRVLIPLPPTDFDPTEAAVPWKILKEEGIKIIFSTPTGSPACADPRMVTGQGLGPWSSLLRADNNGRRAYEEMIVSEEFKNPLRWSQIEHEEYHGLILPGGHAPGMKLYLESATLQTLVSQFFSANKLVAAICHGVVLASRSRNLSGKSVLHGRKTTALLKSQELTAWAMTCLWLKDYYRTYPETVQSEVSRHLATSEDFLTGPTPIKRDSIENLKPGFVVEAGNYISARWPGDAHTFGLAIAKRLK
jgi:protease I